MKFHFRAYIKNKRGRVISVGENSYTKTHPMQKLYADMCGLPDKMFIHAEISAIVRCKNPEEAHSIVVHRVRDGVDAEIVEPCPICKTAILKEMIDIEYA